MENANARKFRGTLKGAFEMGTADMPALSFTGRIASWSARHRWWVVAASAIFVVLAIFILNTVENQDPRLQR